jgi:hypothetical protein
MNLEKRRRTEGNEVAPASSGSFRASRPKPATDEVSLCGAINSGRLSAKPFRRDAELNPPEAGATNSIPRHLPLLACQAEALAKAGAQIFFQTGEGAVKGGGVLPVREIGDAIFCGLLSPNSDRDRKIHRFSYSSVSTVTSGKACGVALLPARRTAFDR